MRDPIEHYDYPEEWVKRAVEKFGRREVERRIKSGLFILTDNGWLRRGITTGTTATASALAAVISAYENVECVDVKTPVGINVKVRVEAKDGVAIAKKFSGDHEFDVTNGIAIKSMVIDKRGILFGRGIGRLRGKPSVSRHVLRQIKENLNGYDYKGVLISVLGGEKVAERTDNARLGIKGGISLLGSTGFVEPWCRKLVETKISIAKQYEKVAITTGRGGWKIAKEYFRDFKPFVFGIHIDEALRNLDCEIVIVGMPSLLVKWAIPELRGRILKGISFERYERIILNKAKSINENVREVYLIKV